MKKSIFKRFIEEAFSKLSIVSGVVITIMVTSFVVYAISKPFTFTSGTQISSNQMNSSFDKVFSLIANPTGNSDSNFTVLDSDHNKLFLVGSAAIAQLPTAGAASSGFTVTFKTKDGTTVEIRPAGGDSIDNNTASYFLMADQTVITLVSDGSAWHSTLKQGTAYRANGIACDADGVGASQCYNNTAAMTLGVGIVDGITIEWDSGNSVWYKSSDSSQYLVDDEGSMIAESFVTNRLFANAGAKTVIGKTVGVAGGDVYYDVGGNGYLAPSAFTSAATPAINSDSYINDNFNATNVCALKGMKLPKYSQTRCTDAVNGLPNLCSKEDERPCNELTSTSVSDGTMKHCDSTSIQLMSYTMQGFIRCVYEY